VSDSSRKQRYEEAERASISRRCDSTSATLTTGAVAIVGAVSGVGGRGHIGTGDIGRNGKVSRQCQVCALVENRYSVTTTYDLWRMSERPEVLPGRGYRHLHYRRFELSRWHRLKRR